MFFVVALAVPLVILALGGVAAWRWDEGVRRVVTAVAGAVRPRTETAIAWLVDRTGGVRGTVLWLGATLVAFTGVTWLAGAVVAIPADDAGALPGEPALMRALMESRTAARTTAMRWLTTLGDLYTAVSLILVVGVAWRLRRGGWAALGYLAVAYGGGLFLYNAAKILVARTRPAEPFALHVEPGSAFPSGHTMQAAAIYTALAILLVAVLRRWWARVAVATAAAMIIVVVATTRLYLGAHWPTDVVASMPLGAGWALLSWWCASSRTTPDVLTVDVPARSDLYENPRLP